MNTENLGETQSVLVIDIGNSRTKFGLFEGEVVSYGWLIETLELGNPYNWSRVIGMGLAKRELELHSLAGIGISSVVPRKTEALMKSLERSPDFPAGLPLMVINSGNYPYKVLYETPDTLGADRLADAAAAFARYGGPVVVVDFGTAVTINAIGAEGEFIGGVIAPGPRAMLSALERRTVQLHSSMNDGHFPLQVLCRTSESAISAGVTYGLLELVDGLIDLFELELGEVKTVVATGGAGEAYSSRSRWIKEYHPQLTLEGIGRIFNHSRIVA